MYIYCQISVACTHVSVVDLIHNLSDGSSMCVDHSRGERLSAVCGGCGRLDAIRYLSSGGKGACGAADQGSTDISDIRSGSFGYLLVLPVSAFEIGSGAWRYLRARSW